MFVYGITVFLSSFLLFLVQPLIGKYILPWYGGTPGVWTSCLLFFQVMLLAGYGYAHWLASVFQSRRQVVIHTALLALSLLCLPMMPSESWKTASVDHPTLTIVLLLVATVGAPYLLLAASAPLIQNWFSIAHPQRSPYRLYAVSNAASLGALLAYPFLFERFLRLPAQCYGWSWAYAAYLIAVVGCAGSVLRSRATRVRNVPSADSDDSPRAAAVSGLDQVLWVALSASGTLLLMATTNQITQDVAPIPFLWVLPLSLYLLSFVICFDHPRWYQRDLLTWLFVGSLLFSAVLQFLVARPSIPLQVLRYSLCLFMGCMCCHGELILLRPPARWLTKYYLLISLGGSLGGGFVALVAPRVFTDYREYWLGLGVTCLLVLLGRRYDAISERLQAWGPIKLGLSATMLAALLVLLVGCWQPNDLLERNAATLAQGRNFYGTLRILQVDQSAADRSRNVMSHGTTRHGFQYLEAQRAAEPTAYYDRQSGIGVALLTLPQCRDHAALRVGVVGLGVGTVAAYAGRGDQVTFYEINPLVVRMSEEYFSFQRDARQRGAQVDVRLGDGRLLLEAELQAQGSNQFDLLAIDAFSSDSVPVHLLTRECFQTYWQHLSERGILAVHISNLYLDLRPVVMEHARQRGAECYLVHQPVEDATAGKSITFSSDWVLMTLDREVSRLLAATGNVKPLPLLTPSLPRWTDNYSSLFEVLR